jgi:hypothetical protein
MVKFADLHITEQLEITLTIIGWCGIHKCRTIEKLAVARDQSLAELWADVCAEAGLDLCEPWDGWPAGPKKETFANARGANQEIPPEWKERFELIERLPAPFRKPTKQ